MKILIAADSFKDALDATSVCLAIEKGIKKVDPTFETICIPMADGGEGSLEVISPIHSLPPKKDHSARPINAYN